MNKTYQGTRSADHSISITVRNATDEHELPLRHDLRNHSESFEWGYAGSGPAQLALAILADHLGVPEAEEDKWVPFQNYQQFKFDVISKLPKDGWKITSDEIERWLKEKGTEQ